MISIIEETIKRTLTDKNAIVQASKFEGGNFLITAFWSNNTKIKSFQGSMNGLKKTWIFEIKPWLIQNRK